MLWAKSCLDELVIIIIDTLKGDFSLSISPSPTANKKLIRKTEKTYGWDFNAAGKVLNKKLTVVIFT